MVALDQTFKARQMCVPLLAPLTVFKAVHPTILERRATRRLGLVLLGRAPERLSLEVLRRWSGIGTRNGTARRPAGFTAAYWCWAIELAHLPQRTGPGGQY